MYPNQYATSSPICLDERKFPITRDCYNQKWYPAEAPNCTFRQTAATVFDDFAQFPGFTPHIISENQAVYKSQPMQWNNECIKFGCTHDIQQFAKFFSDHREWYWLPKRRYARYYPFVSMTPGDGWGEIMEHDNPLGQDDCLIINFSNRSIRATRCENRFAHLCVYSFKSPLLQLACSTNEVTTRFQTNSTKCYRLDDAQACDQYFHYKKPYDRTIYRALLDEYGYSEYCRIQVDPFKGRDIFDSGFWNNSVRNISYVNWAGNMNSTSNLTQAYVAADHDGFWHLRNTVKCAACERSIQVRIPIMFLIFDPIRITLELTVLNQEFIWTEDSDEPQITCYTTATDSLLANTKIKDLIWFEVINMSDLVDNPNVMQIASITKAIYEVDLIGNGPGDFWCNAITYPNFDVISSNKVVAYDNKKGVVFAFDTTHLCQYFCSTSFIKEELKNYSKQFMRFLEKQELGLLIEDVRVMDIIAVGQRNITFLFHVSISINEDDLPEDLEEYDFDDCDDIDWTRNINIINYVGNQLSKKPLLGPDFVNVTFGHIFYCVSEFKDNRNVSRLISARIGERAVLPKLCLNANLVLNSLHCEGRFPRGAFWGAAESSNCDQGYTIPALTIQLFETATQANLTITDMLLVEEITNDSELNPTDLFLIGSMMRNFARSTSARIRTWRDIQTITNVFSNTLRTTRSTAMTSNSHMNATNILVDSYEKIVCNLAINSTIFVPESFNEMGVITMESRNTVTFIIDPSIRNVTGVALFRNSHTISTYQVTESTLKNITIKYLFANSTTKTLLEDELLESATFFPEDLLNRINDINVTASINGTVPLKPPLRIVLSVIKNDILFRSNSDNITLKPVSRVITASIPGHDQHLPSLYPILFRVNSDFNTSEDFECGFWKFQSSEGNISEWSNDGCFFVAKSSHANNPVVLCSCSHLTNFAFLMTGKFNQEVPPEEEGELEKHQKNLDLLTIIGCSMSLIGIFCIWITAFMFRSWREKEGTRVLLQLSLAIAFQTFLILVTNIEGILGANRLSCVAMGVLLHYSVLVVFSWMLITGYLQYLRYVVVFGNLLPKRFFAKALTVGWIVPFTPIIIILSVNYNNYVPEGVADFHNVICYPQGQALYYGVLFPVAMIFIVNVVIFAMVIYSITKGLQKCKNRKGANRIQMAQLRLTILLFFLLGLTWIFGLLVHIEGDSLIFTYLFCVTATMQGFVLFFYFIILDPGTRKLWFQYIKCCKTVELNSTTFNS